MENEIDELARLMWASWGGSDPDSSWKGLDEAYKFKWKAQAELLIDNGYRRTSPSLIPLDRFNIRNLLTEYFEYDAAYGYQASLESLDGIIESFLNLGQPRSLSMEDIEEIMHKSFFKSMRKMNPYDAKHIKCYAKAIHDLLTKGVK